MYFFIIRKKIYKVLQTSTTIMHAHKIYTFKQAIYDRCFKIFFFHLNNFFFLLADISCINKIQREFKLQNRHCNCPNPCRWIDSSTAIFFSHFRRIVVFQKKKNKPKFSFIRFSRSSIKIIHTLIIWYFREKKFSLFPSSRQWPTTKYSVRIRCGGSIILW